MDAVIAGEVCEETGLDYSDVDNSTMKLLGIGRDVIRGGKPDMYFVGKTRLSGGEFETKWRNARSREETEKLIFVPAPFVDGIGAGEGVAFVNWVSDTMKSYELQDLSVSTPATMANIGLWVKGLLLEAKR